MAPKREGGKLVAENRKARFNYDIEEKLEAGIALLGSEVKSLREAHVQFADANGWIRDGECWLLGLHIAPYSHAAGVNGHNPDRERKLLLRRDEILRLKSRVDQERLALIPLSLYFKDGRVKVELALGKGKDVRDKRRDVSDRDAKRDIERAVKSGGRSAYE